MQKAKLAILDMYQGVPNQGMRCIQELVEAYADQLTYQVYDVRGAAQLPNLSDFDFFISTGGPGNPLEGDGIWDKAYYQLLDDIWAWNQNNVEKKYGLFICHSFQMAVHHLGLAQITKRQSMSFGTFPVHLTDAGIGEPAFSGLNDPFWAADFRDFQAIQPDESRFEALGAEILALEKIRSHVPLERAIMAIRFSPEWLGVQFHPEADPDGMIVHFLDPQRRETVIAEHGAEKYHRMLADMRHPERIARTHDLIIPQFLRQSLEQIGVENTLSATY